MPLPDVLVQPRQPTPAVALLPSEALTTSRPQSVHTLRDLALIRRIRDQHDEKAYAELLDYYHQPMKRFVGRRVNRSAEVNDLTLGLVKSLVQMLHRLVRRGR